jgi:NhaP-type Na+/H+ and K+/H+ antiporter
MEKDLKELVVVDGMVEAEIIKAKLESFGIPALLKFESAGRLFGITMDGLGKVKVLVNEAQYMEAKKIIETEGGSSGDRS